MPNEPSSPVCYMAEADDVYMGYASRIELLTVLNELLEAERAGAKVAWASSRMLGTGPYTDLMRLVRNDEARWCGMLAAQIVRLDGAPSRATGAFRKKALAIADPFERLAFLNRGQTWVVRRIEGILPRVRDERLHGALTEMLNSHKCNIQSADALLRADGGGRPAHI